jgi:hypothetical protein
VHLDRVRDEAVANVDPAGNRVARVRFSGCLGRRGILKKTSLRPRLSHRVFCEPINSLPFIEMFFSRTHEWRLTIFSQAVDSF